jgi:hypothetical protein
LVLVALNGPLIYSFREGNLSHFLIAPLAMALLYLRSGRELSAGLLLGLVAALKPPLALLGVYSAVTGRVRVVVGGLISICVCVATSILLFGFPMLTTWFHESIAANTRGVVPAYNAQSFASVVLRWVLNDPKSVGDWSGHVLTGAAKTVMNGVGFLVIALAFLPAVLDILRKWRSHARASEGALRSAGDRMNVAIPAASAEADLCLVILASLLCSPLSWTHHYSLAILAVALLLGREVQWNARGELPRAILCIALVLMSLPLCVIQLQSSLREPLNIVAVSFTFLGGLILYVMLLTVRFKRSLAPSII